MPTIDSTHYDRQGNPISFGEWAALYAEGNNVKKTDVGDSHVSTIYVGSSPAGVYETMVFFNGTPEKCPHCGQDIDVDEPQFRYATEAEAVAHHDAIVEALRKGEAIPDGKDLTDGD